MKVAEEVAKVNHEFLPVAREEAQTGGEAKHQGQAMNSTMWSTLYFSRSKIDMLYKVYPIGFDADMALRSFASDFGRQTSLSLSVASR